MSPGQRRTFSQAMRMAGAHQTPSLWKPSGAKVRELMIGGDHRALVEYDTLGRDAELSIPTPDHYLPLLYVLGASDPGESVTFPVEGMDGGSISMLSVQFG